MTRGISWESLSVMSCRIGPMTEGLARSINML